MRFKKALKDAKIDVEMGQRRWMMTNEIAAKPGSKNPILKSHEEIMDKLQDFKLTEELAKELTQDFFQGE